ncbi:MAG: hypothetical protein ACP5O1_04110 [Phycisphaerae bacterium]
MEPLNRASAKPFPETVAGASPTNGDLVVREPANLRTIRLGIVVPCRGDQAILPLCLDSLHPFSHAGDRIIVVDGDSDPAVKSAALARDMFYQADADGRRGIAIAAGVQWLLSRNEVDALLVCHADMQLRPSTREALACALGPDARRTWGWLGHRIDDHRLKFRIVEKGNHLRAAAFHMPYGDQGMFVGVELLSEIGGWPLQPTMEDMELSLRLRRLKKPTRIDAPVTIGPRHWARGVCRSTVRNWCFAAGYILARRQVSIHEVAR